MARSKDPKDEDNFQLTLVIGAAILAMLALMWFLRSQYLVYYTAPILRFLGSPWSLMDKPTWQAINEAYVFYRQQPARVDVVSYAKYVNICLMPSAYVMSVVLIAVSALRFKKKSADMFRRKIKPQQLMSQISGTFTNIIPVMHLGDLLMKSKLPLWRRQTFPEDVWKEGKVRGMPISSGSHIFEERVREYFYGGPLNQLKNGRRWSAMLGYLVCHLSKDVEAVGKKSFGARFSSEGKVLLGLLAAHAFGGRDGKTDYQKAKDQLNRSCAGHANGLPNLTVAQWIYDKYKDHPDVIGLFRVHQWEYSFLFALFVLAKKNGKATHTDWIWLKPTNRILFYALNTVGRSTPPVESATVYSQYYYELKVHKKGWLPFVPGEDRKPVLDPEGHPVHQIMVESCIKDFVEQFKNYQTKSDPDDRYWSTAKTLGDDGVDEMLSKSLERFRAEAGEISGSLAEVALPEKTEFDLQMEELAAKAAAKD